ncbi:MAG: Do family serine endopeptidase [Gemmatimonadota bacterium]
MGNGWRTGTLALVSALFLVGCGNGDALAQERQAERRMQQEQLGDVPTVVDTSAAAALSATFRAAAAQAMPSVVTVQVTTRPQGSQRQTPFPFPFFEQPPQGEAPPQVGTGSGFVFTAEGHILTNNHVVENATDITIRFPDGRIYDDVEVVGRDPNSDIAVVLINDGDEFRPLEIGNSDRLQVGDWVLALGYPLGLGFTVTAGIVSAKGRSLGIIQRETAIEAFIQTDAAINRGNSGGPLVDLFGRVIGVNTAIFSPTGAYAGNGFAVPSAIAVSVAGDLIEYGHVRRPQLGVRISPVNEAQAELYGLDRIAGAFVSEVVPGGPADEAGLRPEDVIVSLDGQPIEDSSDLITRLARRDPGAEVTLGVVRDGQRRNVEVELGEFEAEPAETEVARGGTSAQELLGLEITDVTPRILGDLGIDRDVDGVVVTGVSSLGPAAGQLQRGDIILELNRQRVTSVRDLQRVVRGIERGDVVVVRVISAATGNEAVRTFRVR